MNWSKIISTLFYPIIIPTLGVLLYLILIPSQFEKQQKIVLLGVVFTATYVIPFFLLYFLKNLGYLSNFEAHKIEERKIPVLLIITLFFILGKFFSQPPIYKDISYLFYGTSFSLLLVYLLFFVKIKASLHMLSIGGCIGFFLVFQQLYNVAILPIIAFLFVLAGLIGTSRLNLKAHTPKEVYIGFFIGVLGQFSVYWFL